LNYLWYATLFIVKDDLVCTYIYEVARPPLRPLPQSIISPTWVSAWE